LKYYTPEQKPSQQQVGAKAYHLVRLLQNKFLVPKSVFIPVIVYSEFLADNDLTSYLNDFKQNVDIQKIKSAAAKIRDLIITSQFSAEGLQTLQTIAELFPDKVAVRSSGINEDSEQQSFAGQYDTILNVPAIAASLAESLKKVWASQWNDNAVEYLLKMNQKKFEDGMGVIIQQMVQPDIAGVLFTRDPNNPSNDKIIIEYIEGLGDDLVSGLKTPQHLELPRSEKDVSRNRIFPEKFSNQLQFLARESLKIEQVHETPVDIEWAVEQNKVYFLQSRPLTTVSEEIIWSNENVGEVIPDVVTPYSWSILKPITNDAFAKFLKILNIKKFPVQGLFDLYKGKVYFNHSIFNKLLSGFYLGEQLKNKSSISKFTYLIQHLPVMIRIGTFLLRLSAKIKHYLASSEKSIKKIRFTSKSNSDLHLAQCDAIIKTHRQTMFLHLSCSIFAELYYQLLDKICSINIPSNKKISADTLLAGIEGADSAQSGRALWHLAKEISVDQTLKDLFINSEETEIERQLDNSDFGRIMKGKIQSFIERFGHGSLHEFELFYPRWHEDRSYIYTNLKNYVISLPQFDWQSNQIDLKNKQKIVYQEAEKNFPFLVKTLFRYIFKKALFYSAQRENLKQAFIKAHSELKKHLLAISDFLKLPEPLDIFFLTDVEIIKAAKKHLQEKVVHILINNRKQERNEYLQIEHPIKVRQVGSRWYPLIENGNNDYSEGLSGIACSAGIVQGTARVIIKPEEFKRMERGDILITRATNPGWTPLFVLAAAVVTEIGGALSHGAIIAREYGLPMVSAVSGITEKIKDGQLIRVDGFSGTVDIVEGKI